MGIVQQINVPPSRSHRLPLLAIAATLIVLVFHHAPMWMKNSALAWFAAQLLLAERPGCRWYRMLRGDVNGMMLWFNWAVGWYGT